MGRNEAIADGIEFYWDPHRGARGGTGVYVYKVKCEVCGAPTEAINYGRMMHYRCPKCKAKRERHKKEVETAWFEVIEEKGERRFNKALDKIQAQVKDFTEYEKPARLARKAQDKYGSVPEAMVAVELLRLGYPFIPQKRIGQYRVDFYIPKLKAVVEVDGKIFHGGPLNEREARINMAIGWNNKIIHVPAERIEKDIQKLGAIINAIINKP